jgi:hypothetical protein
VDEHWVLYVQAVPDDKQAVASYLLLVITSSNRVDCELVAKVTAMSVTNVRVIVFIIKVIEEKAAFSIPFQFI